MSLGRFPEAMGVGLGECRDGVQRGATFQGLPTGLLLGRAGRRRHGCQVHSGRHKKTCSGSHGKGRFILKIDPEETKQMLSTSIWQKVGRNCGPLFNSSIASSSFLSQGVPTFCSPSLECAPTLTSSPLVGCFSFRSHLDVTSSSCPDAPTPLPSQAPDPLLPHLSSLPS